MKRNQEPLNDESEQRRESEKKRLRAIERSEKRLGSVCEWVSALGTVNKEQRKEMGILLESRKCRLKKPRAVCDLEVEWDRSDVGYVSMRRV